MRLRFALISALLALLIAPATGLGQVTFDQGSPSGKEYAIPLEQARNEASGDSTQPTAQHGDRTAPLFGEGIGDSTTVASTQNTPSVDPVDVSKVGSSVGKSQKSAANDDGLKDANGGARRVSAADAALKATVPTGGASSLLTIGALAFAVLLLGSVLGSIARNRS